MPTPLLSLTCSPNTSCLGIAKTLGDVAIRADHKEHIKPGSRVNQNINRQTESASVLSCKLGNLNDGFPDPKNKGLFGQRYIPSRECNYDNVANCPKAEDRQTLAPDAAVAHAAVAHTMSFDLNGPPPQVIQDNDLALMSPMTGNNPAFELGV